MAESLKITIPKGDTYEVEFILKLNGSPWDVSGYKHFLQVKGAKSASAPLVLNIEGSAGGDDNNEVLFGFDHEDTVKLSVATYYYDYKIYKEDGTLVKTPAKQEELEIELTMKPEIT